MRRALIASAISIAAVVMMAAPAGADAVLIETQPATGQVYASSPKTVVLRFNESVQVGLGGIRIFDSNGHRIVTGPPTHPNGDGPSVSVTVPTLKNGTYVATWRVISADGHPVQNAFTFSIGAETRTQGNAQKFANQLLSSQGGSRLVGVINGTVRFVEFAASGLLLGGFAFLVLCWPAGRRSVVELRMLRGAWIAAFVGAVVAIPIESGYTAGLSLADSFKPSVMRAYVDTSIGHVMVLRVVVLLLIFGLGRVTSRRAPFDTLRTAGGIALRLGLIATFTFASHARTGIQVPLALLTDFVHVTAFSLWFGGLVVLVVAVLRPDDPSELEPTVGRFSNLALASVIVLVGTGVYQGWRQVGSFGALKSTTYGHLLLIKVALVAVAVLVAAYTRDTVHQRLGVDQEGPDDETAEVRQPLPVGPGAALADLQLEDRADTARRLRISVGIEVVFLVGVLAVTALLVNAAPARSAIQAPFSTTVAGKGLNFEVLMIPARKGPNELHVTVLQPNGVLANVLSTEATLSNPDPTKNIAPITVTLIRLGPGHYTSNGLIIPFSGKWTLVMKSLVTDVDEVAVATTVPVRS